MNPRLIVRVPELPEAAVVEVPREAAVLVGREPDPSKLPPTHMHAGGAPVKTVALASAQVSGNHLLAERRAGGLFLRDLESRNGSWLRLVPGREVRLPEVDLTLDLARAAAPATPDEGPEDADWMDIADFAEAVRGAVERWVHARGLRAEVTLRCPDPAPPRTASFGLAEGSSLALRQGADATLTSGWLDRVRAYVHEQNLLFEERRKHDDEFVMASPALRQAHRQVVEAAQRGRRLVLLGETGSGKEILARCYHRHSARERGPYEVIHCGGMLNVELVSAALFGAQAGAYTGCVSDVPGAVAVADGGTLFLDEIGDLPESVQVALLRFLDKKGEYKRLGDARTYRADVRVVSATSKDLEALVEQGRFRADLWYRLAGEVLRVPPLRERPEDLLAFLRRYEVREGLSAYDALTPEARALVLDQPWRGNFRDLENFAGRIVSVMTGDRCDADACRRALRLKGAASVSAGAPLPVEHVALPGGRVEVKVSREVWREIQARASAAWAEDRHDQSPFDWGALERFQEQYVKPLFVAYVCRAHDVAHLSRGLNYSQMARLLKLSDGSRVKAYLKRYVERFGQAPARGTP